MWYSLMLDVNCHVHTGKGSAALRLSRGESFWPQVTQWELTAGQAAHHEGLRQIPVIQRHVRLDACCQQRVDEASVEG